METLERRDDGERRVPRAAGSGRQTAALPAPSAAPVGDDVAEDERAEDERAEDERAEDDWDGDDGTAARADGDGDDRAVAARGTGERAVASPGAARLRALVAEAGFSHRELARWINTLAERRGQHLGCTHTSVARWLAGAQPRWPIPALLADALSRRLGYEITVTDIGMRDRRPPAVTETDGLAVARTADDVRRSVAELSGRDASRRNLLLGSTFAPSAFAEPVLFWITHGEEDEDRASEVGARVGLSDVARIRQTVRAFRQLDVEQGGRELRDTVIRHLHGVARGKLYGSYSSDVGSALFAAVAELTELAAWLSFDSGRHALAQRYHILALRLAQAAGDRPYGAYVLVNMACQAVYLRHGWAAVQLARAARSGAGSLVSERMAALINAMEARGHAVLGSFRPAAQALDAAERALDVAEDTSEPWCAYFNEAELHHEFAHCFRDLGNHRQTERFAARAVALRGATYARRRAQDLTFIAAAQVGMRELDAACNNGLRAIRLASTVSSHQCGDYLRDLLRRLEPFRDAPIVRDFAAQVGDILPQSA